MGSGSNWYQLGNKACYILKVWEKYISKQRRYSVIAENCMVNRLWT